MATSTLEQIASQLITQAQGASGQLLLDNSVIQSDSFASVLQVLALPKGLTVQVSASAPASNIYVQNGTLFVTGQGQAYGGQLPDFELQLVGEVESTRTAAVTGTLSALNINQLVSNQLVSNNSLSTLLPSLPFSSLPLTAESNPAGGGGPLMTLSVGTSGNEWPILPDLGITMTGVGLTLQRTQLAQQLTVTGAFQLGSKAVNISLTVPASSFVLPVWTIELNGPTSGIINLADLSTLLAGTNVFEQLPGDMTAVGSFGLKELQVSFQPTSLTASSVQQVMVNFGTTLPWKLVDGFSINTVGAQLTVLNPFVSGSRRTTVLIYGSVSLGSGPTASSLDVTMTIPLGGADWVLNAAGQLDLSNLSAFETLPGGYSTSQMNLPAEVSGAALVLNYFTVSYNPSSRQLSYITFSALLKATWWIIDQQLGLSNPMLTVYVPGASLQNPPPLSASASGLLLMPDNVVLSLSANYARNTAWSFAAALAPGSQVNLISLAKFLLNTDVNPAASLGLNELLITAFAASVVSDTKNNKTTYSLSGTTVGSWDVTFGLLPPINFQADLAVSYDGTYTNVALGVPLNVFGVKFKVSYLLQNNKTQLQLDWSGFRFTYDQSKSLITATGGDWTLGGILTALVNEIDPDLDFTLPDPWNLLNSISLKGLQLSIDLNTKQVTVSYSVTVKLFFINITGIGLTVQDGSVMVALQGSYLDGKPIPAWDAVNGAPPAVPGSGDDLFDLRFAAFGQHVTLAGVNPPATVQDAINDYTKYLKPPNQSSSTVPVVSGKNAPVGALVFDETSNWMLAADFTVAKFYTVQFVFNDPNLYGLRIAIAKTAEYFGNLDFEIMYKKISDSIGMYQADLQLPDQFRHLEFGEVSITIPNIGIKVYTNGNFYLDIGFPASITDFSRSFSVQVFPFVGFGGFYFGYLNGATSTNVPKTTYGQFNPVIEAGLGLSLGVGKTINEGILSAGLSLTAVGIFQGVLGFYTCYADSSQTDTYYRFQATVAIVGRVYGSINFAIISAQFDITISLSLSLTIEAYRAIPITFQAYVSVSLTVKINLGLFKISISLKFSTTITASFSIGSDTSQNALWNRSCTTASREMLRAAPMLLRTSADALVWQPLLIDTKQAIKLSFVPHLTVSQPGGKQQGEYVAMLYIDAPDPSSTNTNETSSLGTLASGVLAWTLNALLNSGSTGTTYASLLTQTVTADDLSLLLCVFENQPNNVPPFNYINGSNSTTSNNTTSNSTTSNNDASSFLRQFFAFNIAPVQTGAGEMHAAVFPPFPELQLQTVYNGTNSQVVNFATQSMTGPDYIADVTTMLQKLGVSYETSLAASQDTTDCSQVDNSGTVSNPNLSLPTFFFTDFLALLAKTMLQNGLDYFKAADKTSATVQDLLTGVRTTTNIISLSGMASRFLLHGLRLPTPPVADLGAIQPFYVLTGQQLDVPATLKTTDTYAVQLLQATDTGWLNFVGGVPPLGQNPPPKTIALPITLPAAELQRVLDTVSVTMTPTLKSAPAAMVNFSDDPQAFTLGSPALWQYPGQLFAGVANSPYLLKLPGNLQTELSILAGQSVSFDLLSLDSGAAQPKPVAVQNYSWGTTVSVSIQKIAADALGSPLQGNMYNLIGTDDVGVSFLQDLVSYLDSAAGQGFLGTVQLLYQADPANNTAGGFISALNNTTTPPDQLALAIIQANLSTDTNPESNVMARALRMTAGTTANNTLNSFRDFVTLLWECSIVRSGGYYLYYNAVANGNAGLPDALFDANGAAKVQILITYPQFLAQPFINAAVVGDLLDYSRTTVYAQSSSLTVRTATLPPGTVGYTLQRTAPADYAPTTTPPTKAEDEVYLEHQFNLVGATLAGVPSYQNLLPSGPVDQIDPVTGANTGDPTVWYYSGIIPYYEFVQTGQGLYGFLDPYAGVGSSPAIQLNWQDMFGNVLPFAAGTGSVSQPLLYTDPLLAVSQWPSTTVGYAFGGTNSAPTVQLTFGFATTRYQGNGAVNNAAIDLQTWMRLWFQLQHAADLSASFTVSIDGTQAAPQGSARVLDLSQLQTQFVRPVIDYLYAVANPQLHLTATPPAAYQVSSAISPTSITTYTYIFPLTVTVTLSRTAHIDPSFAHTPGVSSAATDIQPQTAAGGSSATAITDFATQFEQLFNAGGPVYLKVATATNLSSATTTATATPPIWVVRFDTSGKQGIGLQYGQDKQGNTLAAYYAPIPLATSLQSFSTTVFGYTTGQPYPGAGATNNFTGIDLDNWGQQMLEAVDRFLTPAYAVPAFLLDNGVSLQLLLDAKQQLAEAVTGTVDNIIVSDAAQQANVRNAQEKWLQQLLIQLGSAYAYTAAVQTPVSVQSCWAGPNNDPPVAGGPPRLYGQMVGAPPSAGDSDLFEQEFSLSTAKLPVGNAPSWLSYLFQCKDAADFASFPFGGMQFAVSHLEWNYEQVEGVEGYLGSSWLALVLPAALPTSFTNVGAVSVPVPLRAYPTPPSVTQQSAVNPSASVDPTENAVLQARSWDYQFSYQASNVNQDTVAVQVQLNTPGNNGSSSGNNALQSTPLTLPQALGQFMAVYPAISADLDQYLTQVKGPATSGNAWLAVQAFIQVVQGVATAWSSWNQVNPLKPSGLRAAALKLQDTPTLLKQNYQVEESSLDENPQNPLLVTVTATAPDQQTNPLPQLLTVDIPGYTRHEDGSGSGWVRYSYTDPNHDNQPVPFADRNVVPTRLSTLPDVDILNQQNGWAGLRIIRNQDLLPVPGSTTDWQPTNPRFIYQTPLVMFFSQLAPLFADGTRIDMAQLPAADGSPAAPRSLADNLAAFGAALTQEVSLSQLTTKVQAEYTYQLPAGLPVTLPVLLALPFDLSTADKGQSFATSLAQALSGWQQQQQPNTNAGQWLLDVSIFSSFGSGPPMLRLSFGLLLSAIQG